MRRLSRSAGLALLSLLSCTPRETQQSNRPPIAYFQPKQESGGARVPPESTSPDGPVVPQDDLSPGLASGPRCGNAEGQLMHPEMFFNQPVNEMKRSARSERIVRYLADHQPKRFLFQTDFSLTLLGANAQTEKRTFTATDDHYVPDCDVSPVPIPLGGAIEGEASYACSSDGDCHLLVADTDGCRLYEMWRANIVRDAFRGGCLSVWSLSERYTDSLRGQHCTSADAAGLPIAPLLFTPDEIHAGEIRHAIRFVIPNEHIQARTYVRPATHSTPATRGGADAPPYGSVMRLKPSFDESKLSAPAQVVARALKRYGMILADAGDLTFTASSDRFTEKKWTDIAFRADSLKALSWLDFEVVDTGPPRRWTGNCERDVLSE